MIKIRLAAILIIDDEETYAFNVVGSKLYFIATTTANGSELYSYDGSTSPSRVTDLAPGNLNGAGNARAYKGHILFSGSTTGSNYQLYKYDPATNAATLAQTITTTGDASIQYFYSDTGKLYFAASDGTHGVEIWTYNDTVAMVADLSPGSSSSVPSDFQLWNGNVYLDADNGISGYELYRFSAPDNNTTPSGIQVVTFAGDVKVYPNPAGANTHIELTLREPQVLTVKVTDMVGHVIFTTGLTSYPANTTIVDVPLNAVVAGNYLYNVYDKQGRMQASGVIVRQ